MLDVAGELLPELGVELEHLHQLRHVDALQEAVGQRPHVRAGLDHGQLARAGGQGDVAPHQVALACHSGTRYSAAVKDGANASLGRLVFRQKKRIPL